MYYFTNFHLHICVRNLHIKLNVAQVIQLTTIVYVTLSSLSTYDVHFYECSSVISQCIPHSITHKTGVTYGKRIRHSYKTRLQTSASQDLLYHSALSPKHINKRRKKNASTVQNSLEYEITSPCCQLAIATASRLLRTRETETETNERAKPPIPQTHSL